MTGETLIHVHALYVHVHMYVQGFIWGGSEEGHLAPPEQSLNEALYILDVNTHVHVHVRTYMYIYMYVLLYIRVYFLSH